MITLKSLDFIFKIVIKIMFNKLWYIYGGGFYSHHAELQKICSPSVFEWKLSFRKMFKSINFRNDKRAMAKYIYQPKNCLHYPLYMCSKNLAESQKLRNVYILLGFLYYTMILRLGGFKCRPFKIKCVDKLFEH